MLRLEEIRSGYGRTMVLQGLTMEVAAGDMVAILGRNGVGKTTMLRTIMGYLRIMSGNLLLDGQDIARSPVHTRARQGIAYVPQGREIFADLSVLDNLRVAAYGTRQTEWRETLDELLEEFPVLAQKHNQRGGSLSGGQQQILVVARALITKPRVLLLDEPSEGIQPSIVDEIAELVRSVNEDRRITVLLVEQNLDFAVRVARHAYIMGRGEIVRDLPTSEVLADKDLQHKYLGV